MELSKRLRAVADLVTRGSRAADIGCDHAYVPIWLVRQGICPHVIALDINQGPLLRAKEHIAAYGLDDYIEARLSDGTAGLLCGEADTLIAAGMGGRLTLKILEEGMEKACRMKEWVLQPQSELTMVRRRLRERGHRIVRENIIWEDGKFYPMFRVIPSGAPAEPEAQKRIPGEAVRAGLAGAGISAEEIMQVHDKYGRLLLEEQNLVLKDYLLWEQDNDDRIKESLKAAGSWVNPEERAAAEPGSGTGNSRRKERLESLEKDRRLREYAFSYYR